MTEIVRTLVVRVDIDWLGDIVTEGLEQSTNVQWPFMEYTTPTTFRLVGANLGGMVVWKMSRKNQPQWMSLENNICLKTERQINF